MKYNNKGVTIVELIVSFAIVAVAIIYFFQTLTTVNKLYKTSRKETNEYVEKTYILKVLDAYLDNEISNIKDIESFKNFYNKQSEYLINISTLCNNFNLKCQEIEYENDWEAFFQPFLAISYDYADDKKNLNGIWLKFSFVLKDSSTQSYLYKYIDLSNLNPKIDSDDLSDS